MKGEQRQNALMEKKDRVVRHRFLGFLVEALRDLQFLQREKEEGVRHLAVSEEPLPALRLHLHLTKFC